MTIKILIFLMIFIQYMICPLSSLAQHSKGYWQQRANYKIDVSINANNHIFFGNEHIQYINNSPDTLNVIYFHLFFNAFKPNSKMDIRSRSIPDPDPRVGSRILELSPEEEGDISIRELDLMVKDVKTNKLRKLPINFTTFETIMRAHIPEEVLPHDTLQLYLEFTGQIPKQIRRAGRESKEGIAYSMTQWYPKIAEYDYTGWHTDPYIGREFHGVWGNYDVNIEIDKEYIIGGTGVLINKDDIGFGYSDNKKSNNNASSIKNNWHFVANNVIDFAFAADPDYIHTHVQVPNGPKLHFFYQDGEYTKAWEALPQKMIKAMTYLSKTLGAYPYQQYSFIQGGDGGMEYPMCTLITGNRSEKSLVSVATHELIHTWFQMIFATNESYFPWMDEGFTSYFSAQVAEILKGSNKANHQVGHAGYLSLIKKRIQEPATTHADQYDLNETYSHTVYSKGAVFMGLLREIVGDKNFFKALKRYYYNWAFKHPTPNDFIRCFEKVSGLELNWFLNYMINTTKTIDYEVEHISEIGIAESEITLKMNGSLPVPFFVDVHTKTGNKRFYIPLDLTIGTYKLPKNITVLKEWEWVNKTYKFLIDTNLEDIEAVIIDPDNLIPETDKSNNIFPQKKQ